MERIYPESNPYVVLGEPNRFLGEDLDELRAQILGELIITRYQKGVGLCITTLIIICSHEPELSFMLKYLDPA